MKGVVRATLLAVTSSGWAAGALTTSCGKLEDLKEVQAEIGIIQSLSRPHTPLSDALFEPLLKNDLTRMLDGVKELFASLRVGMAGFSSYRPDPKGNRDFCYKQYIDLHSDIAAVSKVINGLVADTSMPTDMDSSLTAALMALTHMHFSNSTQTRIFRVLLIQSDETPGFTTGVTNNAFKGDGSDTCAADPPTLDKVNELLESNDAYLSVIAYEGVKSQWDEVCRKIKRCSVDSSEGIFLTNAPQFYDVLTRSFCKFRDAATTTSTAKIYDSTSLSGTHSLTCDLTWIALLLLAAAL